MRKASNTKSNSESSRSLRNFAKTGARAHVVAFSGPLVVARAETIRDELMGAIERYDHIDIDCSAATDADITFVQILIAARTTATGWGKSVRLSTSGKPVDTALAASGLDGDLIPRQGPVPSSSIQHEI